MLASLTDIIEKQGVTVENVQTSYGLSFGAGKISEGVYTTDRFNAAAKEGIIMLTGLSQGRVWDLVLGKRQLTIWGRKT